MMNGRRYGAGQHPKIHHRLAERIMWASLPAPKLLERARRNSITAWFECQLLVFRPTINNPFFLQLSFHAE